METSCFYMLLYVLLPLLLLFVKPSCSNNAAFKFESMGEGSNFTVRGVACHGAHCGLFLNNHILLAKDHVNVLLSDLDNTVVALKLVEGLRADQHGGPPTSIILLAYDRFEPSIIGHPELVSVDFNSRRILMDGTPKASWTEAQMKAGWPLIFPSWDESSNCEDKILWRELSHTLMMQNDVPQAFHLWDDEKEAFVKHRESFSDPWVNPNSLQASSAVALVNPQHTANPNINDIPRFVVPSQMHHVHHQQSSSGPVINARPSLNMHLQQSSRGPLIYRMPHTHGNQGCPDFFRLRFLNYFKVEGVSCLGQKCEMMYKNYKVHGPQTQTLTIKLTDPSHQVLAFKAVLRQGTAIYDLLLLYDPFWPEIGCSDFVTIDAHRERKSDGQFVDEVKSSTFPPLNHQQQQQQHADIIFWRRLTARWDDVIGIGNYQLWDSDKSEFSKYRNQQNDPYISGSP